MKFACYCRVSTQEQNLQNQRDSLIQYCKNNNWEYEVFEEKISGTKDSRPVLDKMLQKVRNKEFDGVMVWKLDRLGRSTIHVINLIEEFNNKNIQFVSITQGIDTKSAHGKFFLTILAGFGELERESIRERTLKGLERAKKQGKVLGRPKGSKDKKKRRKSGYYTRWSKN